MHLNQMILTQTITGPGTFHLSDLVHPSIQFPNRTPWLSAQGQLLFNNIFWFSKYEQQMKRTIFNTNAPPPEIPFLPFGMDWRFPLIDKIKLQFFRWLEETRYIDK